MYRNCSVGVQTDAPELYVLEATLDTLTLAGPGVYSSRSSSLLSSSDFNTGFAGQSKLPPIAGKDVTTERCRQVHVYIYI